jgi:hypothetical protein
MVFLLGDNKEKAKFLLKLRKIIYTDLKYKNPKASVQQNHTAVNEVLFKANTQFRNLVTEWIPAIISLTKLIKKLTSYFAEEAIHPHSCSELLQCLDHTFAFVVRMINANFNMIGAHACLDATVVAYCDEAYKMIFTDVAPLHNCSSYKEGERLLYLLTKGLMNEHSFDHFVKHVVSRSLINTDMYISLFSAQDSYGIFPDLTFSDDYKMTTSPDLYDPDVLWYCYTILRARSNIAEECPRVLYTCLLICKENKFDEYKTFKEACDEVDEKNQGENGMRMPIGVLPKVAFKLVDKIDKEGKTPMVILQKPEVIEKLLNDLDP